MVDDASGCQLPLAPLVNISLSPGKILSASVVSLTKLDWNDLTVHPEPELSADNIKPQGLDNSRRATSWIDISGLVLGQCGRVYVSATTALI